MMTCEFKQLIILENRSTERLSLNLSIIKVHISLSVIPSVFNRSFDVWIWFLGRNAPAEESTCGYLSRSPLSHCQNWLNRVFTIVCFCKWMIALLIGCIIDDWIGWINRSIVQHVTSHFHGSMRSIAVLEEGVPLCE